MACAAPGQRSQDLAPVGGPGGGWGGMGTRGLQKGPSGRECRGEAWNVADRANIPTPKQTQQDRSDDKRWDPVSLRAGWTNGSWTLHSQDRYSIRQPVGRAPEDKAGLATVLRARCPRGRLPGTHGRQAGAGRLHARGWRPRAQVSGFEGAPWLRPSSRTWRPKLPSGASPPPPAPRPPQQPCCALSGRGACDGHLRAAVLAVPPAPAAAPEAEFSVRTKCFLGHGGMVPDPRAGHQRGPAPEAGPQGAPSTR